MHICFQLFEVELFSVHLLKLVRGQLIGEITGTKLILSTFRLRYDLVDFLRDEARDECGSPLHIRVRIFHFNRANCLAEVELAVNRHLTVHQLLLIRLSRICELQAGDKLLGLSP